MATPVDSQTDGNETNNLAVARQLLTSLLSGDKDQAISLINENFEMSLPVSVSAGPVHGIDAFAKHLVSVPRTFEGEAKFEELACVAVGDSVVLEVKIIGQARSGKRYENLYVHWFELEAGKVSHWREHTDTKYAFKVLAGR